MKKSVKSLLTIILGAFILYLIRNYVFFSYKGQVLVILEALYLFSIGCSFKEKKARYKRKLISNAIILTIFILVIILQINGSNMDVVNAIINTIGLNDLLFYVIYLYIGYIFG